MQGAYSSGVSWQTRITAAPQLLRQMTFILTPMLPNTGLLRNGAVGIAAVVTLAWLTIPLGLTPVPLAFREGPSAWPLWVLVTLSLFLLGNVIVVLLMGWRREWTPTTALIVLAVGMWCILGGKLLHDFGLSWWYTPGPPMGLVSQVSGVMFPMFPGIVMAAIGLWELDPSQLENPIPLNRWSVGGAVGIVLIAELLIDLVSTVVGTIFVLWASKVRHVPIFHPHTGFWAHVPSWVFEFIRDVVPLLGRWPIGYVFVPLVALAWYKWARRDNPVRSAYLTVVCLGIVILLISPRWQESVIVAANGQGAEWGSLGAEIVWQNLYAEWDHGSVPRNWVEVRRRGPIGGLILTIVGFVGERLRYYRDEGTERFSGKPDAA